MAIEEIERFAGEPAGSAPRNSQRSSGCAALVRVGQSRPPAWEHEVVRALSFRVGPEGVAFAPRVCQNAAQVACDAKTRRIKAWSSQEYRAVFLRQTIE